MKKYGILLLLVAIFSAFVPLSHADTADVPDFRRVAGNYVTDGERVNSRKGYRVYAYDCSLDIRENFAEEYCNLLLQSGLIYNGHEAKDFRRTSAHYIDKWFFSYRGYPVEFWAYRYFDEGRTSFSVRVSNGLTYEGY